MNEPKFTSLGGVITWLHPQLYDGAPIEVIDEALRLLQVQKQDEMLMQMRWDLERQRGVAFESLLFITARVNRLLPPGEPQDFSERKLYDAINQWLDTEAGLENQRIVAANPKVVLPVTDEERAARAQLRAELLRRDAQHVAADAARRARMLADIE